MMELHVYIMHCSYKTVQRKSVLTIERDRSYRIYPFVNQALLVALMTPIKDLSKGVVVEQFVKPTKAKFTFDKVILVD